MWSKVRDWGASIGMFLVSAALGVVAANQVFEASRLLFPILIPVNPQEMSAWNRLMVTGDRLVRGGCRHHASLHASAAGPRALVAAVPLDLAGRGDSHRAGEFGDIRHARPLREGAPNVGASPPIRLVSD